jgi:perosamine synthetase
MKEDENETLERVPMSAPDISEEDIAAVVKVLRSGRLSLGPMQDEFETLVAEYVGVEHAVAVSSGTAALHLLVRALGLGPGDEVLVPSFTFAASVNCILYERATPVFVDIEPDTYNLDPRDLERKVTKRTRAIIAVDVFGHPADWDEISRIARQYELHVIDDSCEALGARYHGRPLGGFGEASTFAFYANKQITAAEGGMVVTADARVAELCRSWRNQGRGKMGAWLAHERLGYNYRMDEMSAALGASQMRRFESLLAKRSAVARNYGEQLGGIPWLRTPVVRPDVRMSWFVYVVTLKRGLDRDAIISRMMDSGVPARSYFPPVHLQPYFGEIMATRRSAAEGWDWGPGSLPVTEDVGSRTIALPFHNNLTEAQREVVVKALEDAAAPQL